MEGWRRLLPLLVVGGVVVIAVYAAGAIGDTAMSTTTSTTIVPSLIDEALSDPVLNGCQGEPAELEPPTEAETVGAGTQESVNPPTAVGAEPRVAAVVMLIADYQFQNSFASSVGVAPDLVEIGSGSSGFTDEAVVGRTRNVLTFASGSGLSLAPTAGVIDSEEYTIELLFRLGSLAGWRKLIDFKNASEDGGLYSLDGRLNFYPTEPAVGATIDVDSYVQVVLTRDASPRVVGYVNGVRQFSFCDMGDLAVIDANDTLRFFSDDTVTNSEYSGGAVSRIRLYDGPLTGGDVAGLAAESSSTRLPSIPSMML